MRILIFLIFASLKIQSQNGFTTNNGELDEIYDRYTIKQPTERFFQDVKPYNRSNIYNTIIEVVEENSKYYDNFVSPYIDEELNDISTLDERTNNEYGNTGFFPNQASFFGVEADILNLRVNPILDLKLGQQKENGMPYNYTRGVELAGSIGKVINFYGQFTENQYKPYSYVHEYGTGFYGQNKFDFNPYYTYWKDINNYSGYDFSNSIGYLEYKPSSYISIAFGHDRNFYGYGYRSLFLGDNGAPYVQLKINVYIWKLHYQMLFTEFTNQYIRGADRLLPKKYGAFHLLSFKPNPRLEVGVYEGVVFNRNNGYELNYLNPLIYYHSVEHNLGSPDNAMMGFQAKWQPSSHLQFYTQFLLDDIQVGQFLKSSGWWGNKYGGQFGFKVIDIANIQTLDIQAEVNAVRPYTYSHYSADSLAAVANFTNYNQPLAHPFGANFIEFFWKTTYRPMPKLKLELKYDYSVRGMDNNGVFNGQNIFQNTDGQNISNLFNNQIAQGTQNNVQILSLNTQYQLFHNLYVDFDFIYRNSAIPSLNITNNTVGFMAGIRMNFKKRDFLF
jgi:hypothetical protein